MKSVIINIILLLFLGIGNYDWNDSQPSTSSFLLNEIPASNSIFLSTA